ncbi:DUF1186 domain-containing protein [Methylobacterium organophilum]|uniref:DUF1186 domain-containing protein n=1 Tax=Methylobacterium organophilum TaxID=410 RepID=UPI001F136CE7|nr:DUF1186 domain-containing protein [Methylobacterium organophilum]UMY17693.1 DUF1186 domain-containing protein [Methylobacterium organophilum]
MDADLVAVLSEERYRPVEALKRAVAQPEAIAEPVLALLDKAAGDSDCLDDGEANLLFWGLHALAAARDTRVLAPLLRFLRSDGEAIDALLGDATTETLPAILASCFDDDAAGLGRLILDSTVDGFVRNSAFAALGFLTRQGRISREAATALLVRFDEGRAAVEEDPAWIGWEETIAYLGIAGLAPRAEAARRDGRLTDAYSDAAWFRKALRQASAAPPDLSSFEPGHYAYLDDPVTALAWTDEAAGQPVTNPYKGVGRNDPCPCGSGKKYKKCCLEAGVIAASKPPLLPGLH